MEKKNAVPLAILLATSGMQACQKAREVPATPDATVNLSSFQRASMVIGQRNFTDSLPNGGGSANAEAISAPFGNPAVVDGRLYVPDYGNKRVLGFDPVPVTMDTSASFVLGQPDLVTTSGAGQLAGPQTVKSHDGKLFVDDYDGSRIVVWNQVPVATLAQADMVIGQDASGTSTPACLATALSYPESFEIAGGRLIVSDTGNNRVLIWNGIPAASEIPAEVVLGQNAFDTCAANDDLQTGTGGTVSARTLSSPTGVWSDGSRLIVADSSNNRVLVWNSIPTESFTPADVVLGQGDFSHNMSNDDDQDGRPDAAPSSRTLAFPYFLDSNGRQLFVVDSGNHRVLVWNSIPTESFTPADVVLGQSDFSHDVPNDDDQDGAPGSPSARTFWDPRGILVAGTKLVVADGNNNRFLVFESR